MPVLNTIALALSAVAGVGGAVQQASAANAQKKDMKKQAAQAAALRAAELKKKADPDEVDVIVGVEQAERRKAPALKTGGLAGGVSASKVGGL